MGTINYQSPETLSNSKQIVERSADIWGIGCITYEILTGKSLFKK